MMVSIHFIIFHVFFFIHYNFLNYVILLNRLIFAWLVHTYTTTSTTTLKVNITLKFKIYKISLHSLKTYYYNNNNYYLFNKKYFFFIAAD